MTSPAGPSARRPRRPPGHPLYALTTFELREYRRQLESAIAFFDTENHMPSARGGLQARLNAVIAEQDDRARLTANA